MGSRPLTPVQSTPVNTAHHIMLIEEEAEAVFNEIRNMRKEILADEDTDSKLSGASPGSKSVSPTPIITINVKVLSSPERSVSEIEEPVSPPSCHPDEGPPLLFSQSIEDLAAVIVKENRQGGNKETEEVEQKPVIGQAASLPSKTVPALIPLTVSEFAERPAGSPPSLRMSGGGVYTTESYYRNKPAQTSVIKKLPVPSLAPTPPVTPAPTDCGTNVPVIQSVPEPKTGAQQQEQNVLRKFYKTSTLLSSARTIKLSDGLEITPILPVAGRSVKPAQKRSHESRKNSKEEQSEQRVLTPNEQTFDCKLVISRIAKKAKLVFENGSEVPLSKNILKHVVPPSRSAPAQSKRIRRKTARTRKVSNSNLDSKPKNSEPAEDEKAPGPLTPPVDLDMPLVVNEDSAKTEIPESCNKDSKLPAAGQHKLPSIVSPPSYHNSWAKRKISMKSK